MDYDGVSMELTFSESVSTECVRINITGDAIPEGDETFNMILTSSTNRVILDPNTVTVIIEGLVIITGV